MFPIGVHQSNGQFVTIVCVLVQILEEFHSSVTTRASISIHDAKLVGCGICMV